MAGPQSPLFFKTPFRYLKWASINKPAYFYSIVIGCAGPVLVFTVPPIRRYLGEERIAKIPMTYPGMWSASEEPSSYLRHEQRKRAEDVENKKKAAAGDVGDDKKHDPKDVR